MKYLAIDTAAGFCAACVYDAQAGVELGRDVIELAKGHAEHVMAVIGRALENAGISYDRLDAVAVCVGPGSFTGVRVGVSAARGLALARGIPAIGVTSLEALAVEAREVSPGQAVLVALGQRAEGLFAAAYDAAGEVLMEAASVPVDDLAGWARKARPLLCGSAAGLVAEKAGVTLAMGSLAATADIATYARLAAAGGTEGPRPKPLYLRAPDAAPQQNFALPRREA
ncbi:peptidase M22, glycoprotease [Nitratireductor indicus C115]|uniref:Peptidase M22, glycoprotease n=1 Tax=Nitratireductor indicus C115 TaxID=1231190 RepID=K2NYC2_9HYPH|nr:tRNA (adenosine(37)-N6)-threonylcarbamoyltransferase complex dimerization subunit type 1 TsaB [Nitratireductor indicus]EKF44245.1 peptidase M22, glycoprotease [Nitratireductor indicus C115]SFQ26022.1 tRNA threonylcarbamoyl adenosine modification protein YeaZ [Nitratireductor indicus]